jgi:hypothetical protein
MSKPEVVNISYFLHACYKSAHLFLLHLIALTQNVHFIVSLSTAAATACPGRCRLPMWWNCRVWGDNKRETPWHLCHEKCTNFWAAIKIPVMVSASRVLSLDDESRASKLAGPTGPLQQPSGVASLTADNSEEEMPTNSPSPTCAKLRTLVT